MLGRIQSKLLAAVFVYLVSASALAFEPNPVTENFGTSPVLNDGQKWRVVFYEGGPHSNYYHYLEATILGLMKLGWIERADLDKIQSKNKDTRRLWNWLARDARSDYLEFVADGYYSANWDDQQRRENRGRILESLKRDTDIDLVIAMGTWAGLDLANDEHSVPTVVMSTSDPVESGIIQSVDDSGYDHVHARVDPYRYERQLRIFHDLIK